MLYLPLLCTCNAQALPFGCYEAPLQLLVLLHVVCGSGLDKLQRITVTSCDFMLCEVKFRIQIIGCQGSVAFAGEL
jgi:hypothetical protein